VTAPKWVMVPERLTAENGAKAALSGEFYVTHWEDCPECEDDPERLTDCPICEGEGRVKSSEPITWTQIKEIWDLAIAHFAAAPQPPADAVSSVDYWQRRGHVVCAKCNGSKIRSYRQADHLGGGYVDVPCDCTYTHPPADVVRAALESKADELTARYRVLGSSYNEGASDAAEEMLSAYDDAMLEEREARP
jgi:hypothetical protein